MAKEKVKVFSVDHPAAFDLETSWDKVEAERRIEVLKQHYDILGEEVRKQKKEGYDALSTIIDRKKKQVMKINPLYNEEQTVKIMKRIKRTLKNVLTSDAFDCEFIPERKTHAQYEEVSRLNMAVKNDKILMGTDVMRDKVVDHICDYGLGIVVQHGYDAIEEKPLWMVANPLNVTMDAYHTEDTAQEYFGFYSWSIWERLESNPEYFNLGEIREGIIKKDKDYQEFIEHSQEREGSDLRISPNKEVSLYHHYIRYCGHLYLTTWIDEVNTLVRIREITPTTKIEEKDLFKITIPVVFYRISNTPGYYFGESVPDMVEPEQDYATTLRRLRTISAIRLAYWPDLIYNASLIEPKAIAKKKIGGNTFGYKPKDDEPILPTQVMANLQENTPSAFINYEEEKIGENAERNAGLGNAMQQGVSGQGNQTAKEVTELRRASDETLNYMTESLVRQEARFWSLWLNAYRRKFGLSAIKTLKYGLDKKSIGKTLEAKHFNLDISDIKIVSKNLLEAEKRKNYTLGQLTLNLVLQNTEPGSPIFERLIREQIYNSGIYHSMEQVYELRPLTKEEELANDIMLLTDDDMEFPIAKSYPGLRLDWVLQELKKGKETESLFKAIEKIERLQLLDMQKREIEAKAQMEAQIQPTQEVEPTQEGTGGNVDPNTQNQLVNTLMQSGQGLPA